MSNIFCALPILDKPEWRSVATLYDSIFSSKHKIIPNVLESDSLISRVRNNQISIFLQDFKQCEYFFCLDSDLEIINKYQTNNIFNKLIDNDLDFVGAIYPVKDPSSNRCASIAVDLNSNFEFDSGLREMKYLSSGCWMIKRSALEKMVEAYPQLVYDGEGQMAHKKVYGLCIPYIKDCVDMNGNNYKKYLSEDWSFCSRWCDIGGKIYADTSIVLNHIGRYPYSLWNIKVEKKEI